MSPSSNTTKATIWEHLDELPDSEKNPYIHHIRFPRYKKFVPSARINFNYPITAIVGMNGSSKTSVLRAVYGTPEGYSIADYWFETNIDTIDDIDTTTKNPASAFIYGYHNTHFDRIVEILKTRINKKDNPDYWEPARPQKQLGMEPMPSFVLGDENKGRSQTRWNTIKKKVVYLDFRHEAVSAFDKAFYNQNSNAKNIKDKIRKRSKILKKIIDGEKQQYSWYSREILKENINLHQPEIDEISKILGKPYKSIRIITHSLYTGNMDKTIYLSSDDGLHYSEAFAGSGEFAVVSLVHEVMQAEKKSLIILDEPEVSVHPGAQKNMITFLAKQALKKHHQIVYSTHSPAMIEDLPPKAIKVLYQTSNGLIDIRENISPSEAFTTIGADYPKKTIIVEDETAKIIIEYILEETNRINNFDVLHAPNGAEWLKTTSILDSALFKRENVIYILDGDKKPHTSLEHIDPNTIPPIKNTSLQDIINKQAGCRITIPRPSNNNNEYIKNQRTYLDFYFKNVFYFSTNLPEEIIWESIPNTEKKGIIGDDLKENFRKLTEYLFAGKGKDTSENILAVQKMNLRHLDVIKNPHCKHLCKIIDQFLL